MNASMNEAKTHITVTHDAHIAKMCNVGKTFSEKYCADIKCSCGYEREFIEDVDTIHSAMIMFALESFPVI